MNQNLVLFITFSLTGMILIGCLLLNQDRMPNVWKRGILGGFIGSGLAAVGIYVPQYILAPCILYSVGVVWMLSHVFYHYYNSPMMVLAKPTDEQIADRKEQQHSTVKILAFGMIILLGFSVILGFTQGQKDSIRVQSSFTNALDRISNELSVLNKRVGQLYNRVGELEKKADKSAVGDSVARKQSFKNQEQLLHQRR